MKLVMVLMLKLDDVTQLMKSQKHFSEDFIITSTMLKLWRSWSAFDFIRSINFFTLEGVDTYDNIEHNRAVIGLKVQLGGYKINEKGSVMEFLDV